MNKHQLAFEIKLFLADGCPEGLKIIQKSNWNGFGVALPRSLFSKYRQRAELDKPGVYLLLSQDELGSQLYIGEGDPMIRRLEEHFRDKDWWQTIIAFTANSLNKAFIKFLEARLVRRMRHCGRFISKNSNNPTEPTLTEMDLATCEGFLQEMLLCLTVLGVNLNIPIASKVESAADTLFINAKGIHAEGFVCPEGFMIRKDSMTVGKDSETKTIPPGILALRKTLQDNGILKERDNKLRFTQDYQFSSPSTAAAVVLGCSANGLALWKTSEGSSLKTLQINEIE